MKKTILFFLLFIPLVSFSQLFNGGFIVGFSGSQIDGDTQRGYKKLGAVSGVFLETISQKKASLLIELYYAGKGAVLNYKYDDGTSTQEFKSNLHYLEMPISIKYKLNEYFHFSGGLAPSYLLKSTLYYFDSEIPESTYQMKDINFSILLQSGYKLNEKIAFHLGVSYSLTSIREDKYWINSNILFSLRYKIKSH